METECRLDLAHKNLDFVPVALIKNFKFTVQVVDLSNNRIRDVSFLEGFSKLTSIIVDHNELNSDVIFPRLPQVKLLWMNYNWLNKLYPFIERIAYSFPNLQHLSLMGNLVVPPCSEDTFYNYLQYRLFVISRLESLRYLDDRFVSEDEKQEAVRLYRKPQEKFDLGIMVSGALAKIKQFVVDPVVMGHREDSIGARFI